MDELCRSVCRPGWVGYHHDDGWCDNDHEQKHDGAAGLNVRYQGDQ